MDALNVTLKDLVYIIGIVLSVAAAFYRQSSKIDSLKKDIRSLSDQIDLDRDSHMRIETKIQDNQNRIQEHSRQFAKQQAEIAKHQADMAHTNVSIAEIKSTINNVDSKLDRLIEKHL